MREGFRNGALFTLAIVITILVVVMVKAMMMPLRTSVDIQAFRTENFLFESHAHMGFKPKPNAKVMEYAGSKAVAILTDDRGARISGGAVVSPKKSHILGVGCSQTWGFGVQNEETFLSRVGSELGMTVDNFAVSGFGGTGALLQVEEHMTLRPNIVIYGLWEDHINRNVNHCLEDSSPVCVERPYLEVLGDGTFRMRMPGSNAENLVLLRRFYLETSEQTDDYRTFGSDIKWVAYDLWSKLKAIISRLGTPDISNSQKIQGMRYILQTMNRLIESHGGQLVVVWIPVYFSIDIHSAPNEFITLSKSDGFVLVDMSGPFQEMIAQGRAIALPTDGHMNPDAHRAIAIAIKERLTMSFARPESSQEVTVQ